MINQLIIFGAKYLYLLIPILAFLFFLKQPRNIRKQIIIFGTIILPLTYLFAKIISFFYYDPRPFVANNIMPLIPHVADNGFPSDHTLLSAAISVVVSPFNKKIGIILWLLTIFVGLSRVFSAIHHFIDIFGSIVIVVGLGFTVWQIMKGRGIIHA